MSPGQDHVSGSESKFQGSWSEEELQLLTPGWTLRLGLKGRSPGGEAGAVTATTSDSTEVLGLATGPQGERKTEGVGEGKEGERNERKAGQGKVSWAGFVSFVFHQGLAG